MSLHPGGLWRGKRVFDVVRLSNGWILLKTENKKSAHDFKVRTIMSLKPRQRSYTPKHAHFAIDFYGKLCSNKQNAIKILQAIVDIWHGREIKETLAHYHIASQSMPGYDLEYILYALRWILEQEDINFKGRPPEKQAELDAICRKLNVSTPHGRKGSQLAISIFCDIASGTHPIEALLKANLDIRPRR